MIVSSLLALFSYVVGHVQLEMPVANEALFPPPSCYEQLLAANEAVLVSQAVACGVAWSCEQAASEGNVDVSACLTGHRVDVAHAVVAEALWGDASNGNGPASVWVSKEALMACAQARLESMLAARSDGFWRELTAAEEEAHRCALPTLLPGAPSADAMFEQLEASAPLSDGERVLRTAHHEVALRASMVHSPAP